MILSAGIAIAALRTAPGAGPPEDLPRKEPTTAFADVIEAGNRQTDGLGEAAFIDWLRDNPMLVNRLLMTVTRGDGVVVYESAGKKPARVSAGRPVIEPVEVSRSEGIYQVQLMPFSRDKFGPVSPVQRSIVRAATRPQLLWLLLLVAIPLSVMMSIAVARYLVSPLRSFERAGKLLASGELNARVSPELGRRSDEIAEFASTFDHMAAKIEGLVQAHQRLLRDVSHELRTPLARVLAAASLARKAADPSSAPEFDRIEREVDRLDGMIGRLLTYAELDAGEARVHRTALSLGELLTGIVEDAHIEADAKGRCIKLEIVSPCDVLGDAQLLKSAIENVLRNALRYTPRHSSVDITLRQLNVSCEVTIRDHGAGVQEEELPHLFKPFYQTDTARTPQGGGYGIGLAIARKAIEVHNGWVEAENVDDGGLLVRITLPLHN